MLIVALEAWHLIEIKPQPVGTTEAQFLASICRHQGPAFAGLSDGVVMGCAGVIIKGDTGYAWAFLSETAREHPMALHRAVARGLQAIVRKHGLKRIEASCHARFFRAQRWLERLGFRCVEWLPDGRGTGEPYMRYVHEWN